MAGEAIRNRLLALEALFETGLKECRKAREELEGVHPLTPRKGKLSGKRLAEIQGKALLAAKKTSLKRVV